MAEQSLRDTRFGQLTVGQLMEKDVQYAHKRDAAKLLASQMMDGFGSVPVVDDDRTLVGIVSEFDLLKALRKGKRLDKVAAEEIMTPRPISALQGMDVLALIDVLQNNHLIRVPVVDGKEKLLGIVARRDILRGYLQADV